MEKMSSEKVKAILLEHGTEVTIEEAKLILDFLNKLAAITVEIYLKKEDAVVGDC